jgi:hypothetical protein
LESKHNKRCASCGSTTTTSETAAQATRLCTRGRDENGDENGELCEEPFAVGGVEARAGFAGLSALGAAHAALGALEYAALGALEYAALGALEYAALGALEYAVPIGAGRLAYTGVTGASTLAAVGCSSLAAGATAATVAASLQAQRASGGTSFSTCSTCLPQPANVGFWHCSHRIRLHMSGFLQANGRPAPQP